MNNQTIARWLLAAAGVVVGGCYQGVPPLEGGFGDAGISGGDGGDGGDDGDGDGGHADVSTAPAPDRVELRRLTRSQYANTLVDLLGEPLTLPTALEPDLVVDLFAGVGATQGTVSGLGIEQFEAAAEDAVDDVFADAGRRSDLVGCEPSAADCFASFAETFGRQAFRRPLTDDEIERYAALGQDVAAVRGDAWEGARAIAIALLSSPSFLYLVELGEPDPTSEDYWRFTSVEMASRLSYAIWNGPPDAELLDVGEAGGLVERAEIKAQVERMLDDSRARRGIGRFTAEWLGLDIIATLNKDLETFPNATPELFAAMHGEATRLAEHAALGEDASLLDILDAQYTFINAELASLYGVSAPTDVDADGFGKVDTSGMDGRRGILGTAGVLAGQSRRTRTAPTIRGMYVQARLRCQDLPPPPADVPMDIPDGTEEDPQTQSIRELLEKHREDPTCAACHQSLDPPGLALEHFDALGAYRTMDAGFPVDAATVVDETEVEGLAGLAAFLRDDPAVRRCMVQQLLRFTTGHRESVEQAETVEALGNGLAAADYNLRAFLPDLFATAAFRYKAPPA